MTDSSAWFWFPSPTDAPRMRLFCFPFACGGTLTFRPWPGYLPADLEVAAVQLPGRERRHGEPALRRMDTLIDRLLEAIVPFTEVPMVFFGHSMGALIAFELARALQRSSCHGAPRHLLVSGRRAPHIARRGSRIFHTLPDPELAHALRRLGGTPEAVFEEPDLLRMVLSVARADFELIETYRYRPGPGLECPITAFHGLSDPEVSLEEAAAWEEHTVSGFSLHTLPGNHFFIHQAMVPLLDHIARITRNV